MSEVVESIRSRRPQIISYLGILKFDAGRVAEKDLATLQNTSIPEVVEYSKISRSVTLGRVDSKPSGFLDLEGRSGISGFPTILKTPMVLNSGEMRRVGIGDQKRPQLFSRRNRSIHYRGSPTLISNISLSKISEKCTSRPRVTVLSETQNYFI